MDAPATPSPATSARAGSGSWMSSGCDRPVDAATVARRRRPGGRFAPARASAPRAGSPPAAPRSQRREAAVPSPAWLAASPVRSGTTRRPDEPA